MVKIIRQSKAYSEVLQRQLSVRAGLWPDVNDNELWKIDKDGWAAVPRLMSLMMSIMDDLSGKGFPVSRTYFEMWCRLREEGFLTLNNAEEMAFHAGFEGQRAVRTWKDRVQRLAKLEFIDVKTGPYGDLSYAIFYNPYHVIKRAYLDKRVQDKKWHALVTRSIEVKAKDIDELDENGNIIVVESGSPDKK